MQQEHLIVPYTTHKRKYSLYKGEISPEVDNLIQRDFSAERPNEKWLTDITEFSIPAGKVYLYGVCPLRPLEKQGYIQRIRLRLL